MLVDEDANSGLSKAFKAFDQLGFAFEMGAGDRYFESPDIR